MKTAQSLTSFFILVFFLLSCTEGLEQQSACVSETKNPCSYNISISEISRIDFSHIFSSNPKTKSGNQAKEIRPVVQEADTLLYVINYGTEDGWVLTSGDKRTNTVLAISENGHFNLDEARRNKGFSIWLDRILADLTYLKRNPSFVPDSTLLLPWEKNDKIPDCKGGIEHEGEWLQLVYVMQEPGFLHYNIDHLMDTHWGQESPWNLCMPFMYNTMTDRCNVCCSAVAGAQTAYYLHSNIGKPYRAYEYGSCVDSCNKKPNPSFSLFNLSSSNWATMVLDSTYTSSSGRNAVSALMADVVKRSSPVWSSEGSSISLAGLLGYFSHYSVSCSSSIFNNETIVNSILNGMPVIVGLSTTNSVAGPHTAVIDGMRVTSYKYTYFYQWMPIGTFPPVEPEFPDLEHPELYEIGEEWGENSSYYYRINWGFDGFLDDVLCLYGYSWGYIYTPDTILYNFH